MPGPQPKYPIELTPEQVAHLSRLSRSSTEPYHRVQRAKALLLASHQPEWGNTRIGREVGYRRQTIREWRRKWCQGGTLEDRERSGAPWRFSALARTQIVALACSAPAEQGKVWKRWSGEKLAQVAGEQGLVERISPSTIRRWLREDRIKPWRYHAWQKSTDPQFVQQAAPVLDLYEQAPQLAEQGELVVGTDEKISIQARKRPQQTQPAIPGQPVHVSDRYERKGAVQLFCALAVATGLTFAQCRATKRFVDFQAFLLALFASVRCQGIDVLHLILDNGSTHAPKRLGGWIASLDLSFEVRVYWLPKHASWLDQVEIIFSKVQRDVLMPNDFSSTQDLEADLLAYFKELNGHPKPIHWTYTRAKLVAKFGDPDQPELVA